MPATSQEAAAARQLADALVEFIAMVDKASIERRANRLAEPEPGRMQSPKAASMGATQHRR